MPRGWNAPQSQWGSPGKRESTFPQIGQDNKDKQCRQTAMIIAQKHLVICSKAGIDVILVTIAEMEKYWESVLRKKIFS